VIIFAVSWAVSIAIYRFKGYDAIEIPTSTGAARLV
jgi:hypothetical protein